MGNIGDYLLAEVMLWLIYAAMAGVVVATMVSVVRSLRNHTDSMAESNQVPRRAIAYGVAIATLLLLVVACLTGSSAPMIVNGVSFTDRFWLKTSDGIITVSLILTVVAVCCVAYGVSGINRHTPSKK